MPFPVHPASHAGTTLIRSYTHDCASYAGSANSAEGRAAQVDDHASAVPQSSASPGLSHPLCGTTCMQSAPAAHHTPERSPHSSHVTGALVNLTRQSKKSPHSPVVHRTYSPP
eukprot:scaffold58913_cov56-Phaeocystis_antarctica.AAC.2